jgi:hypothetical protein
VPTATFRVLLVFVVLSHERRRVVHFGVTEHPTQEWTIQQMREAFPWDQAGGSAYGTAIPLAKSICGTTGGLCLPRIPSLSTNILVAR